MCWLSEKTTAFAIYKRATENRAKIRASPTGRGTVGPVRLSEVWPVGSMRPRFCCVDRREHRMPYRVRSVILGVLSLLLFGPASSAAQSGPTRSSAGRGQRAPHRSGHVARGSPAGTGGPAWGRAGRGAERRAGRSGGSGGTPPQCRTFVQQQRRQPGCPAE